MLAALAVVLIAPATAAADDILVIPIENVIRGAEGDVVALGSVTVPADLVGSTCEVRGRTENQVSVHPGNDLLITTGGQTFVIPNFEDAGFITYEAGVTEALGPTIGLQVRLGPDGISSGGFRVSIDCEPSAEPTTTTETATTEPTVPEPTAPSTTVSAPTPETTNPGPEPEVTTASTGVEAAEPTTETPPTTTPSTEPPAPPTTVPAAPTTETPPAGPTVDDEVGAGLPVTGSSTGAIVGVGLVLVATGMAARRFARVADQPDTAG